VVTVETYQPDPVKWGRMSNKEKKQDFDNNAGWCPHNWKQRPRVDVRRATVVKDFKDIKQAMKDNGSVTEVSPGQFEISKKDTAPHLVKTDNKPLESKTPWLIPVEIREKMMKDGIILKILGRSSEIVNTIEDIKSKESKYSSFSEQMPKLGLEGLMAAFPAEMEHIAFTYPEAIPAILIAYRSCFLKLKEMEKAAALETATKETAPSRPKLTLGRPSVAA
jgi:hypothetical protein